MEMNNAINKNEYRPKSDVDIAIAVQGISKMYPLYRDPLDRLKQSLWHALPKFIQGPPREFYQEFWALQPVSFEVKRGEALGIIGLNGSGKSTLLQIIAGTLTPTTGDTQVNGRVAALLELGSGFNPEFTGRENVYINGAILGFNRDEIDERFDEIAAFADIGDFIDHPVKLYSSGMFVRLAFAVQACVEPDILIVDEALAVGDIFFQQKCHARMEQLLADNTAIMIVSHDIAAIEKYSDQILLLDGGRTLFLGDPQVAIQNYYRLDEQVRLKDSKKTSISQVDTDEDIDDAVDDVSTMVWPDEQMFLDLSQAIVIGSEEMVRCLGIALCNEQGQACTIFQIGEMAHFYYEFELLQDIQMPTGGVEIINRQNVMVHSKNSMNVQIKGPSMTPKGSIVRFRQTMQFNLVQGAYTFGVGFGTLSDQGFQRMISPPFDAPGQNDIVIFRVTQAGQFYVLRKNNPVLFHGYADLPGTATMSIVEPNETSETYYRGKV